jgi:hypothetical protein
MRLWVLTVGDVPAPALAPCNLNAGKWGAVFDVMIGGHARSMLGINIERLSILTS